MRPAPCEISSCTPPSEMKANVLCDIHSPKRAHRNRSAMAAPTALVWPWPSGPEVFSTPRLTSSSGWPGVGLPHWRKFFSSSSV